MHGEGLKEETFGTVKVLIYVSPDFPFPFPPASFTSKPLKPPVLTQGPGGPQLTAASTPNEQRMRRAGGQGEGGGGRKSGWEEGGPGWEPGWEPRRGWRGDFRGRRLAISSAQAAPTR